MVVNGNAGCDGLLDDKRVEYKMAAIAHRQPRAARPHSAPKPSLGTVYLKHSGPSRHFESSKLLWALERVTFQLPGNRAK